MHATGLIQVCNMHWHVSPYNRSIWLFSSSPWLASCCQAICSITVETWSGQRQSVKGWLQANQLKRVHLYQTVELLRTMPIAMQLMDTHQMDILLRWLMGVKWPNHLTYFFNGCSVVDQLQERNKTYILKKFSFISVKLGYQIWHI